jgi:hypothetical protein
MQCVRVGISIETLWTEEGGREGGGGQGVNMQEGECKHPPRHHQS